MYKSSDAVNPSQLRSYSVRQPENFIYNFSVIALHNRRPATLCSR